MAQLLGSKAHAGLRLSDKLNASPFERPADLFDLLELGVDSQPSFSRSGEWLRCRRRLQRPIETAAILLSVLCKNRGAIAGTPIRADWREAAVTVASP